MSTAEIDAITSIKDTSNTKIEVIDSSPKTENRAHKQGRFFYTVGLFNFLIEEDIKAENLYGQTINKVPHTPEWCSGILNVRGNIVPIVDMHVFLKTEADDSGSNKSLLLLEHKNHPPIIFQIDMLPRIAFLDEYSCGILPNESPRWLIQHYNNTTNHLYEIDHSILLSNLKNNKSA